LKLFDTLNQNELFNLMCLAPKMPKPPEPVPPPPEMVNTSKVPLTIKAGMTSRAAMRQASQGPAGLTIPLNAGVGSGSAPTTSMANLSIGGK
jgi:hypothetical protein